MRFTPFLAAILIAGCSTIGPTPGPSLDGISVYEHDPYVLLAATQEQPLKWAVFHSEGFPPGAGALAHLEANLDHIFGPPAHHRVTPPEAVVPASNGREWSKVDLLILAHELRTSISDLGGPSVIFVWIDGRSAPDLGTLAGVALDNAAFIFAESIGTATGPMSPLSPFDPSRPVMERAIALHELGHMLGIVNHGVPMMTPRQTSPDEDPCSCHSTQGDSVMIPGVAILNTLLSGFVDGQFPDEFNAADLEDLTHARAEALRRHAR